MSDELQKTRETLERLEQHAFFRAHGSMWRMLGYNFLRGLAFGLGSVLGATLLVYLVIQMLAQIEFIPIIGEWTAQLINQIETRR
jgi:hypothetical protein